MRVTLGVAGALSMSLLVSSVGVAQDGVVERRVAVVPASIGWGEPAGVCVTVVTETAPEQWHAQALLDALEDGSVVIVGAADPAACAAFVPDVAGPDEAPSAEAAEAWETIKASVFADKYKWQPLLNNLPYLGADKLRKARKQIRQQAVALREVGSHPCYEDTYSRMLDGIKLVDAGIGHVLEGRRPYGRAEISDGVFGLWDYFDERDDIDCTAEG